MTDGPRPAHGQIARIHHHHVELARAVDDMRAGADNRVTEHYQAQPDPTKGATREGTT